MNATISRKVKQTVKQAIRDKYAWPGGYPMFIITHDCAALCIDCAKKKFYQIAWDWTRKTDTGWFAEAVDINWESQDLYCDHCSQQIESAYGEDN